MRTDNSGPTPLTANFSFSALLFSAFGWVLFETQLFNMAAGIRVHLLICACGCAISGIALRRCRLSWPSLVDSDANIERSASNRFHIGDIASCAGLVAAGCALALCAKLGSMALFVLLAGACSVVPCSRIVFCRKHFFMSGAMFGAGAATVSVMVRGYGTPLSYLFCAWVLWVIAVSQLLITLKSDRLATSQHSPQKPTA